MRGLLRVLAGLVLVTCGVLAFACGVVAWTLGERRGAGGGVDDAAFVATLAPVRTDGYAVLVPDVAGVLARHGVARHLGDGRLTITVRSGGPDQATEADLIVVALVPAGDALRHLSGTARAEVRSVGYATGDQPVHAVELGGAAPPGSPPWDAAVPEPGVTAQAGRVVTVSLDVPSRDAMALVVHRWDGGAGFAVTITVGFEPASWGTATAVLLIAGGFATLSGLALLALRRPWVDPAVEIGFDDVPAPPAAADRGAADPPPVRHRRARPHPVPAPPARPASRTAESPYVHTAT